MHENGAALSFTYIQSELDLVLTVREEWSALGSGRHCCENIVLGF